MHAKTWLLAALVTGLAIWAGAQIVVPPAVREVLPTGVGDGLAVETVPQTFTGVGPYVYQYKAKLACGVVSTGQLCLAGPCKLPPAPPPPPVPAITLVDGLYASMVNLVSTRDTSLSIQFVTLLRRSQVGPTPFPVKTISASLRGIEGLQLTCEDAFGPGTLSLPLQEAFVLINATQSVGVINMHTMKNVAVVTRTDP